ncbi:hypothetical protein PV11_08347 [Exophiala sideris]|uniref:Uncharacterized protein n=1 Tax=Exophiala sideris TaxID=1016849 RepID=A0A0D1VX60_9EURO|nr:hypothetical protein PV11_08347 [Exophiala sideris]
MFPVMQKNWQAVMDDCPFFSYSAVLSNPVLILHAMNCFLSCLPTSDVKTSIFETWITAHFDVHADDKLCRAFTVIVVALQLAIYYPKLDNAQNNADKHAHLPRASSKR